jgi:hypothetical protein
MVSSQLVICGEGQRALRFLREALRKNYSIYPAMDSDPLFDSLRNDPEFLKLRNEAIQYHDKLVAEFRKIQQGS